MTDCRNCRRDTDLYLCQLCAKELHALLADLPWLCRQLEITITRQDKLDTGAVGRGSDNPSPINVGAMELGRQLRNQLSTTVRELCESDAVEVPELETNAQMAGWLFEHCRTIVLHASAGQVMRETRNGTEAILAAINRVSRMYCGPCVTITGHNPRGEDIECGADVYANRDDPGTVVCGKCKTEWEPRALLLETIKRRDLLTEKLLIDAMDGIGEPITEATFDKWVHSGRLRPRGYVHHGRIVPERIRRGDPRVFSLSQARQLRWHDQEPAA